MKLCMQLYARVYESMQREAAVAGRQPDVRTYPGFDDQPVCLNQRADVDGAGVGGGGRHVLQSDR